MGSHTLCVYVAASLALIVTPGQDMLYVATRSLAQGRMAGLYSALGVCCGILAHTALAAVGVGAILQASEGLFIALKLVGAGYLVYLGIRLLLTRAVPAELAAGGARLPPLSLFWQGMLSNITNPKIVLFFLAFLPQFVDPTHGPAGLQTLALGLMFNVSGTLVNAAVAWLAGSARTLLESRARRAWFQRASSAILTALGLRLALAR